jgi:DNA-binding transcriptional LysR family regulator
MNVTWNDIELIHVIAAAGSLSAAARKLDTTQPTVSRRLAELEARVGEAIFQRTVAGSRVTAFGERLLAPAQTMADASLAVADVLNNVNAEPRGIVRVTAPPGIAYSLLAPLAVELRRTLPDVTLEIISKVDYVDLVRREADVAIRMPSASQRSRERDQITITERGCKVSAYATADYRASLPRNYSWSDIRWIGWPPPYTDRPPNPQLAARIAGFVPVFASDDYLVQLRAAEAGIGAIWLPTWRSRFDTTRLVPLNVVVNLSVSLQLLSTRNALAIPRVQAVASALRRELDRKPPKIQPST